MALKDYYISKFDGASWERTFFLKTLQTRNSPGGGAALLGSIVPYVDPFLDSDYVIPELYNPTPNIVAGAISQLRGGASAITRIDVPGSSITATRDDDDIVDLNAGPFPSVPVSFGLEFDYTAIDSITTTFGAGTYREYIPRQLFIDLFTSVQGRPTAIMGGSALAEQAVVDSVLYASNYSVIVSSKRGFSTKISAGLAKASTLPGGSISITNNTSNTISIQVSGAVDYLIALSRERWDSFDVT